MMDINYLVIFVEKEFEKIALIFEHFEQQKTSNEKMRSEILIWWQ